MSDPLTFGNQWISSIQALVEAVDDLRYMNDRVTQEPTLGQAYLTASGRTDIVLADLNAAFQQAEALVKAFDTGAPPLKAALYKVLR